MKRIVLLILALCIIASLVRASEDYIDGKKSDEFEVTTWGGISAPSLSPTGYGRIYYDSALNYMLLSENGGAYSRLLTTAVGAGLYWTQATDQTLLTGDKSGSFDLTTTGTGRFTNMGVGITPFSRYGIYNHGHAPAGDYYTGINTAITTTGDNAVIIGVTNTVDVENTQGGQATGLYNEVSNWSNAANSRLIGFETHLNALRTDTTAYGNIITLDNYTINNPTVLQICEYLKNDIIGTDTNNKKWALYNDSPATDATHFGGKIFLGKDNSPTYWGTGYDSYIKFDGNSLNIVANAVTATDNLDITANLLQLNATPIITTGTGTFGSTNQVILGSNGSYCLYASSGNTIVSIGDGVYDFAAAGDIASYFYNSTSFNYVELASASYAIYAGGGTMIDTSSLQNIGIYMSQSQNYAALDANNSGLQRVLLLDAQNSSTYGASAGYFEIVNGSGGGYAVLGIHNDNGGGAAGYFTAVSGTVYLGDVTNNYALNAIGDSLFTGAVTITGTLGAGIGTLTSLNLTADTNQIVLDSDGTFTTTLTDSVATSSKVITLPNFTGTLYISGGTDVTVADGGTGRSVTTAYMPIAGGTTTTAAMQSVATGTIYYPLCYNTNATLPTWQILDVRGGGTGRATLTTAYGLLAAGTTATGATQTCAVGTSGQYLRSNGAALPTFTWGTVQTKIANYTLLLTDDYCLASAASTTITLPTAVGCSGKVFNIKNINADNTLLTVATTSAQTIDGSTTWTSNTPNEALYVLSDGANWRIL